MSRLLTYLQDSNYLSRYTGRLRAQVVVYNRELRMVGYVKLAFRWQVGGGSLALQTMHADGTAVSIYTSACCYGVASWRVPKP